MEAVDALPTDYEPEGREFESLRARHLSYLKSVDCRRFPFAVNSFHWSTVPDFVPTLGIFHRSADRIDLRVHVPLGSAHVSMAGKVRQCPRVHVISGLKSGGNRSSSTFIASLRWKASGG